MTEESDGEEEEEEEEESEQGVMAGVEVGVAYCEPYVGVG